jgi:cytochrome c556
MAKECADKIQNDGGGDINQDALMKMMGSMSGMLGGLPKK